MTKVETRAVSTRLDLHHHGIPPQLNCARSSFVLMWTAVHVTQSEPWPDGSRPLTSRRPWTAFTPSRTFVQIAYAEFAAASAALRPFAHYLVTCPSAGQLQSVWSPFVHYIMHVCPSNLPLAMWWWLRVQKSHIIPAYQGVRKAWPHRNQRLGRGEAKDNAKYCLFSKCSILHQHKRCPGIYASACSKLVVGVHVRGRIIN
jgi:hypothetical protein